MTRWQRIGARLEYLRALREGESLDAELRPRPATPAVPEAVLPPTFDPAPNQFRPTVDPPSSWQVLARQEGKS